MRTGPSASGGEPALTIPSRGGGEPKMVLQSRNIKMKTVSSLLQGSWGAPLAPNPSYKSPKGLGTRPGVPLET